MGLQHLCSNQSTQSTGARHSSLDGVGQRLYTQDTSHSRNGTSSGSCDSLSLLTIHVRSSEGGQSSLFLRTDTALSGHGFCGHPRVSERLPLDRYPSLGFNTGGREHGTLGEPFLGPQLGSLDPYRVIRSTSLVQRPHPQALRPLG